MTEYWAAYVDHHATGEGITRMLALGISEDGARSAFQNNFPEYFWKGMELTSLNEVPFWVVDNIPDPVWELMDECECVQYYSELHIP